MKDLTEELLDRENKSQADPLDQLGMRRTTAIEGKISGYKTAEKTGEYMESSLVTTRHEAARLEIDDKIEEILDIADELLENSKDLILLDNLLDALNSSVDELWNLRDGREREYAKLIVLLKTITKSKCIELANQKQVTALFEILQTFKTPRIAEIDIKHCVRVMKEAGLDPYKPLRSDQKLKIVIEEA